MNRIYKVIYSKARQCYIVVSELAKSNHKSSQQSADHTNTPALARVIAVALAAGALTWGSVPGVSWAADNTTVTDSNENTVTNTASKIKDINANITGKKNTVTDSSNAEIVGDGNTVTNEAKGEDGSVRYVRSNDARIHGSGNTISASRNQQVIGDNNTIMGRDDGTVTDYQHPEGREPNVSDLTIGRGNFIRSTDTYRNEWDSLKVIGNNNRADFNIESAGGPAAGIVIGDNQNIDGIKDSIVIGSLSPSEQQLSPSGKPKEKNEIGDLYSVGANSIIIGYHTKIKRYGEGIVVGNRSQGSGIYETIMGSRSIIGSDSSDPYSGSGAMASIYGAFNKIEDAGSSAESAADVDGVGNSINGSLNITSNARGTMIMGVGNTVTHAKGPDILGKDEDTPGATGYWVASGLYGASYYAQGADTEAEGNNLNIYFDEMRNSWQKYMETSGGAVSVLGNSNNADYAIRSQILGTGNTLQGSETDMSAYNTVSGFANTGTNIKRSAIVGTGNTLKNGEDNVVIGDYHNLENGKHNVILGSMDYTEKQVTKQSKSAWAMTEEHPDGTFEYTFTEQVPVKGHTENIENAVMVGYNTDVTHNGGVALGAGSVASREAQVAGYDPSTKTDSTDSTATWKATNAAVSVGKADGSMTRQITGVAAGSKATDAVNVAQLEKALAGAKDGNDTLKSSTDALKLDGNKLSMKIQDTAGHEVSGSVDLSKFAQAVDTNTTYTFNSQKNNDNTTTITVKDSNGKENSVTVATKDTRNTVKAGENVSLDTKDNADGSHEYTVNVKADGKVEADSTKIVSGDTVYKETRVKQDGKYVKASNTAGENLSVLDNQVASNSSNITNLNGRVNSLDSKVNKVGAGAAALAALHPLDFDSEDKWDFAVGYGNYRDANSVAVGAFYRPDEDTMFNFGTNFGNGENMINAGVSFKFGPKGKSQVRPGSTQEITELRATVARQDDQLKKQDSEIKELKAMVQQLLAAQDKKAATK